MSDTPRIAQKAPYPIDVEEGKSYFWCACGKSQNQPFCDGKHKGTSFVPMVFEAEATETAYYCQCKQTSNAPKCDGTHNTLESPNDSTS